VVEDALQPGKGLVLGTGIGYEVGPCSATHTRPSTSRTAWMLCICSRLVSLK